MMDINRYDLAQVVSVTSRNQRGVKLLRPSVTGTSTIAMTWIFLSYATFCVSFR